MKRIFVLLGCSLFATSVFSQDAPVMNNKLAATSTVLVSAGKSEMSISPNPVQGQAFNLELHNLQKGKYSIYLFDESGKKYVVKVFNFEGGSLSQTLPVPKKADKGVYILQVISKTSRFSKKMIIE